MKTHFFIHIPKNAGMTVRRNEELWSRIEVVVPKFHKSKEYTDALLATMKASGDHHGYEHARWRDLSNSVKNGNYKFFAIVRNPWSRVVSRFNFARMAIEQGKSPKSYCSCNNFEEFLEERFIWGNKEFYWHRAIRLRLFCDKELLF